jgi:hypothetical protein
MKFSLVIAALAVAASPVLSQQVCKPGKDQREAKLLAFFAAPIAFSPAGAAAPLEKGEIRLSFDGTWVPTPSAEMSRPEVCYTDAKRENTSLSDVFPRPRIAIGLTPNLWIEASYLPPITVMDATPNLFSGALGFGKALGASSRTHLSLRAHITVGQVKGPITCNEDAIQTSNPSGTCYATRPSEDTYKPNMLGIEAALGFQNGERLQTYVGTGVTSLRPRFRVGFVDASNNIDNTRVEVDLVRFAAFAGARFEVLSRAALTAEVYSVPQDVTTFRLGGSYSIRTGR